MTATAAMLSRIDSYDRRALEHQKRAYFSPVMPNSTGTLV